MSKIINYSILLFFLAMLVIPTSFQLERGILLVFILTSLIIYFLAYPKKWHLNQQIFFISLLCITFSILFIANGIYNNTPGALRVGTIYVLWPILFLFLMGFISQKVINQLFNIILVGTIFASLIGIFFTLEEYGLLNIGFSSLIMSNLDNVGYGFYDNKISFSLPNLTTVFYGAIFSSSVIFLSRTYNNGITSITITLSWLALSASLITLLISGRRGFWVVFLISPLILITTMFYSKIKIKIPYFFFLPIFASIIYIPFIFDIDWQLTFESIKDGFIFDNIYDESSYYRYLQADILIQEWTQGNMLIGQGHGASARGIIRSDDAPWAYELTYLALLFQTGIIGITVYGGTIIWLIVKSIKIVRYKPETSSIIIPLITSLICFLIINISNPYLQKFDYLWVIFLPLGVLNLFLTKPPEDKLWNIIPN